MSKHEPSLLKEPRVGEELKKMEQVYEPLLPVEKKLIAWSLGLGLVLLAMLYFVSKFLPHSPGGIS
jgi:hypothetical protein